MREDLIESDTEERRRKQHHKKKKGKKSKQSKRKARSHAFIEIQATAPKSASLLQLNQVDSGDLSVDESAELSLKRMAKNMAAYEKQGEVKNELSCDSITISL